MFLFLKFFFYLFLPSQQHHTCRPCRHHSPFTSYSPTSHQKHKTSPNDVQRCCLGSKYVFFCIFFFTWFCHLSSVAHIATTLCWPPTPQHHIRNIKQAQMMSNNIVWAPSMFFFLYFFSHFPMSHQQHKMSPNNVQRCCLGYKYVSSFVFSLLLISATSAASPTSPPLSIDLLLPKITSET